MALSRVEKKILIKKYLNEGMKFNDISRRMFELERSIRSSRQFNKFKKDFKLEFQRLWQ